MNGIEARGLSVFMTYDLLVEQAGWKSHRVGQGILLDGDTVLLSGNRWYSDRPLMWSLPGGRAEEGEGVAEATAREFHEETGLEVEVLHMAFVAEARSAARGQLFLTCAFVTKQLSGTLQCEGDPGVEELRFVPFKDLPLYLPSPSLIEPLRWYLEHPGEGARYWFFPEYADELEQLQDWKGSPR